MRYAKDILCFATCVATCVAIGTMLSLAPSVCSAQQSAERDARLSRALNDPAWRTDERGRVFRVAFPLHDRLLVDYGAVGGRGLDGERGELGHRVHAAWKTTMGLDFAEENIWWRFRHTFADMNYAWGASSGRMRATAVRGDYLRHDMSSFIVIPAKRDLKIPAPFDIAVDYKVGDFDLQVDRGQWSLNRVDVAEVAIPLDFIRDPNYRHRLAIGPAASYRIYPGVEPARHELAPLTGVEALYAWESEDGLYSFDVRARCTNAVTLGGDGDGRWKLGCEGHARAEVIVFSINDQPISVPAEVDISNTYFADDELIWSAWVGLRLSFVNSL